MSIVQVGFVQALPRGACSLSERNLLYSLAWFADHTGGSIFPGLEALAERASMDPRWCRILLRKLERRGWLVPLVKGRGRGHKSSWELRLPGCLEHQQPLPIEPVEKLLKTGRGTRRGKGDRLITKGDRLITSPNDRTSTPPASYPPKITPIRPLIRPVLQEQEQRLRRDQASRTPAEDGNYRIALKLAHLAFEQLGTTDPTDITTTQTLKQHLAAARIAYDGDLVARALASASMQRLLSRPPDPIARRRRARG